MRTSSFWPNEQQIVLLHAILDAPENSRTSVARWLATIDFEGIDEGSQRLMPLLHERLKLLEIDHPLVPRIKGIYRRNWYLAQRLRHQLRFVRAAFGKADVACILLKGAALGHEVYGHHALRPAGDIDLLVRPADFDRAGALLLDAGWRPRPGERSNNAYARTFVSDIGDVDLHVSPFHEDMQYHPLISCLWEDRRTLAIDGETVDLLAEHDQLLHTLAHGLRVNPVPPVRWIVDAVLSIRCHGEHLDWDRFALRAEQLRFTLIAGRGLEFLAREFSVPVPDECLRRLRRHRKGLLERIEVHLGRQDRCMPLVRWASSYRDMDDIDQLTRLRAVASLYREDWKATGPFRFAWRVCLRLLLGRRLTARLFRSAEIGSH